MPPHSTGGRANHPRLTSGLVVSRHSAPVSRPGRETDDLEYLNRAPVLQIASRTPPEKWQAVEARLLGAVRVKDDFVTIPFPRLAANSDSSIAQAAESYKREAAIVDSRLSREVTLAIKATALSDLCDQLRKDTGIHLEAGRSVADEKVTVFCEKLPLREVMRQLSRPFGYTWLRSKRGLDRTDGTAGATTKAEYRYELMQDLRSQLLEEELRNRDRNAALLDVDREMNRYRPYLNLSPDQALARAATAPPEEKKLLEYLAGKGWGPAQLYFQLTPSDLEALRNGQKVSFNAAGRPLPPEMARNVMTSLRDYRIVRHGDSFDGAPVKYLPDGVPPSAVPEAQPMVSLSLDRSELGQLTLHGYSGFYIGTPPNCLQLMGDDDRNLAVGMSPAVRSPENAAANARFARDPALQGRVAVKAVGSRQSPVASSTGPRPMAGDGADRTGVSKVTSADVLEALHRATGLPIVADYYTRLYPASQVAVQNTRRFDALNRLADTMRLRWSKDADRGAGGWLQFRSANFYNDRLKEVPNRLLFRWAASRREHGAQTLEDLIEISQLTDAQLDSNTMAEGARELFGLDGWGLARPSELRANWRFLARLSPEQRDSAQSAAGLSFTKLSLAQQQQFLALLPDTIDPFRSQVDLRQAGLQVEYTVPGGYQWTPPAPDADLASRLTQPPVVRERTRPAALLAAQRIDPQVTDEQIRPTELGLALTFRLGGPDARLTPFVVHIDLHNMIARLPQPVKSDGPAAAGASAASGP
jgi:hypothetical protein